MVGDGRNVCDHPGMTTWEYGELTVLGSKEGAKFEIEVFWTDPAGESTKVEHVRNSAILTAYGRQGWELVAVRHDATHNSSMTVYTMKRPAGSAE
jgi:hypothetical protein